MSASDLAGTPLAWNRPLDDDTDYHGDRGGPDYYRLFLAGDRDTGTREGGQEWVEEMVEEHALHIRSGCSACYVDDDPDRCPEAFRTQRAVAQAWAGYDRIMQGVGFLIGDEADTAALDRCAHCAGRGDCACEPYDAEPPPNYGEGRGW